MPEGNVPLKLDAAMNPEKGLPARSLDASVGQKSTSLPAPSEVCPTPSQRKPRLMVRCGFSLMSSWAKLYRPLTRKERVVSPQRSSATRMLLKFDPPGPVLPSCAALDRKSTRLNSSHQI